MTTEVCTTYTAVHISQPKNTLCHSYSSCSPRSQAQKSFATLNILRQNLTKFADDLQYIPDLFDDKTFEFSALLKPIPELPIRFPGSK